MQKTYQHFCIFCHLITIIPSKNKCWNPSYTKGNNTIVPNKWYASIRNLGQKKKVNITYSIWVRKL